MAERKLADGSNGGSKMQTAAVQAVDAHLKVQRAAAEAVVGLEGLPPREAFVGGPDDSLVHAIERAQRRLAAG